MRRFKANQPRLSPDRAYVERTRDSGSMAGVMALRRTCTVCRCSKTLRGGKSGSRFVCADCR